MLMHKDRIVAVRVLIRNELYDIHLDDLKKIGVSNDCIFDADHESIKVVRKRGEYLSLSQINKMAPPSKRIYDLTFLKKAVRTCLLPYRHNDVT